MSLLIVYPVMREKIAALGRKKAKTKRRFRGEISESL